MLLLFWYEAVSGVLTAHCIWIPRSVSGSEVASLALRLRTIVWSNAFSHGTAAFEVKMFIKKRDNTKYLTKVCLGLNALA